MDDLVKAFYSIEVHLPSFWWVERVPSKSNPADEPSRFEGESAATRWNARFLSKFTCQAQVADWLVRAAANRRFDSSSREMPYNKNLSDDPNRWILKQVPRQLRCTDAA